MENIVGAAEEFWQEPAQSGRCPEKPSGVAAGAISLATKMNITSAERQNQSAAARLPTVLATLTLAMMSKVMSIIRKPLITGLPFALTLAAGIQDIIDDDAIGAWWNRDLRYNWR